MSLFEFDQELHERTMKEIYTEEGREQGIAIGRESGLREGRQEGMLLSYVTSIKNLMETMDLSMEQAMAALKIPESEREDIMMNVSKTKN